MKRAHSDEEGYRIDPLTGLADGDAVRDRLEQWRAGDPPAAVHAMLIALDRFDTVNLAYGEAEGDGALVEVARRLKLVAADELDGVEWFAGRLSGGTFALIAREAISRERWQWLAEAIGDAVAAPIATRHNHGTVRLWPRIALLRVLPGEQGDHVMDRLAATLERFGTRRAARIVWADRQLAPVGIRGAQLAADLVTALDRDEIEVRFQPQHALADQQLTGAEALARWNHPSVGLIGAATLFAMAERSDQVAHLSRHIAECALRAACAWPEDLRLSLNVTPADLAVAGFARDLLALGAQSGFDPRRLTIEITEEALLGDLTQTAASLAHLREHGVAIALDDFGSGFCNFGYLKLLPLDMLKLDRSMLTGIEAGGRDLAVLRAIVALAKALDLQVVAEGIETEEQAAIAAAEGCRTFQGFLRAQPLTQQAFLEYAGVAAQT